MESNLVNAVIGLMSAAQPEHWLNYNEVSYFEKTESSVINFETDDKCDDDDGDDDIFVINESQDLCKPRGCRRTRADSRLPREEIEARGRTIKNPTLKESKKKKQKTNKVSSKKKKSKVIETGEKSLALQPSPIIDDKQPENQANSGSTYFSGFEDSGFDTLLELQSGNAPARNSSFVQLPTTTKSMVSSTISTDNSRTLCFVRLLLEALENETLALEYTTISHSHGSIANTAVDAFVQLVDLTCVKETAQLYVTEVVKCIDEVYERFLKCLNKRALDTDTLWIDHFSILLRLCNSKRICEEFLKFFISRLITPRRTEDSEDPKEIIDGFIEHDQARFCLIQLQNVLKKYVKTVEESGCETNIVSARSYQTSSDPSEHIRPNINELNIQLLQKLNEYAAKNYNFPLLANIAARNLTLLKSNTSTNSIL